MKKIINTIILSSVVLLSGCVEVPTYRPVRVYTVPTSDTTQATTSSTPIVKEVYVVREPYYVYPQVIWGVNVGIGHGHYRGPWRR